MQLNFSGNLLVKLIEGNTQLRREPQRYPKSLLYRTSGFCEQLTSISSALSTYKKHVKPHWS